MEPSLTENFFMFMEEQQQEAVDVEEPRQTQDFIMLMEEHQDEEEELEAEAVEEETEGEELEEEVTLEDALLHLFERFSHLREEFPAEECDWYHMDPEDRTQLALEQVEQIFKKVFEKGDTSLEYPSLSNWDNVQFNAGYGLQPLEDGEIHQSKIRGDSLKKFLHVLDVIRTLLQSNTRTTKRDIFYQHVRDFGSQKEVDRLVSIAVAMLEVSSAPQCPENFLLLTDLL